jgi:GAF domain-containing protein
MLPDEGNLLRIMFVEPADAEYDRGLSFRPDRGGAGIAYARGVTIYFPAVRFRHGIGITDEAYQLLPSAFEPSTRDRFKSVICTPIRCGSSLFGVLNVDSRRRNAFNIVDVQIARVAASAIGMAIDRHNVS